MTEAEREKRLLEAWLARIEAKKVLWEKRIEALEKPKKNRKK